MDLRLVEKNPVLGIIPRAGLVLPHHVVVTFDYSYQGVVQPTNDRRQRVAHVKLRPMDRPCQGLKKKITSWA